MKHTVYIKFLAGYLSIAFVLVICVNFFAEPIIYNHIVGMKGKQLYKEAYAIAQQYSNTKYQPDNMQNDKFINNSTIAYSTDTSIWFLNSTGNIISSTDDYLLTTRVEYISSYFSDEYYAVGNLNGVFKETMLSAVAPVVSSYSVVGYIMIHTDITLVKHEVTQIMNIIYMIVILLLMLSLLILIIYTFSTYIPLKQISKASREFAKGNFDYDGLKIKSNDELGFIASNINFMAEEIKNIDDKQRKFISNCSHDFRSPLTSIKGYLEAMIDGTIPPELYDKYLNIVLTEAERLNKLTSSLLTINKWNTLGTGLELADFDLVPVIRNTVASFEGQCNKKKITMDITFDEKSLMVNADQVKIQQVLYNLIDNAIKFSNDSSTIFLSVTEKNEKVFVSVKDSGIGIPKQSLNKIWDRFYKTDLSRGKDKTGSGLGLSIVKEVITNHGENINVISTEGVGTEFTFSLKKTKKSSILEQTL